MSEYHQFKPSRAFNGISILKLPADKLTLNRGVFVTYDPLHLTPARQQKDFKRPEEDGTRSKETQVVLEGLQRILKRKEEKPKTFEEFSRVRTVR